MWFLYAGTPTGMAASEYAELCTTIPCQEGDGILELESVHLVVVCIE